MALCLADIVDFWAGHQQPGSDGRWCHDQDRPGLSGAEKFGFNLDHPVSPFVGNILDSPVLILNLNGGYDSSRTPAEFKRESAADEWLNRIARPSQTDWNGIPAYYHEANYGRLVLSGKAASINACAYRSEKLKDSGARALASTLPSVRFHRKWLIEAVLPLAAAGGRLVIAHRWGLWNIPPAAQQTPNLLFDLKCRAFPDIDGALLMRANNFAKG